MNRFLMLSVTLATSFSALAGHNDMRKALGESFTCVISHDDDQRLHPKYMGELFVRPGTVELKLEGIADGHGDLRRAAIAVIDGAIVIRDSEDILPEVRLSDLRDQGGVFFGELSTSRTIDAIARTSKPVTFDAQCTPMKE